LQELKFNTVFETGRVSEIYDSYFDNCHVTVQLNSVLKARDSCH